MQILRLLVLWTGFLGAPGYSSFHFTVDGGFWDGGVVGDDAQIAAEGAADRVAAAFNEFRLYLPDTVTYEVRPEAEILDSDTGEIQGFVEIEPRDNSGLADSSGYSAASGAVVNWRTNDYRFGRRIRGRTFLVPLAGNGYEGDGTLSSSARTAIQGFGDTMVNGEGSADFGVWSRPRGGSGGVFATATSFNVPDMAAVLRSRRD